MRIRRKPWARPTLEATSYFVSNPTQHIGQWHSIFEKQQELWLELGCGKGGFLSQLGPANLDKNILGIDIKNEMLIIAKEKIEKAYAAVGKPIHNLRIMTHEIMLIHQMMHAQDTVHRIYINFCNPWFKTRHEKRRLTHPNQLRQYQKFLTKGAEIRFKTDDDELFHASVGYFEGTNFNITYLTEDLHNSGFNENFETEHERMFTEEGKKIKFLIAKTCIENKS